MPYMVALSGWPEPVYVDSALSNGWGRGNGRLDSFDMGRGDGYVEQAVPGAGGSGQSQSQTQSQSRSQAQSHGNAHAHGRFADPRFGAGAAVMHNRGALEVAPGWGSAISVPAAQANAILGKEAVGAPYSMGGLPGMQGLVDGEAKRTDASAGAVGTGVKVPLGKRGEGLLVMRAVPEVYPPPGSSPTRASFAQCSSTVRGGVGAEAGGGEPLKTETSGAADAFSLRQQRSPSRDRANAAHPASGESASGSDSPDGPALASASASNNHGITKHPGMHAHPLARMSLPGMLGVATEVYPRDPDNGILWRNVTNGLAAQRQGDQEKDKTKDRAGADSEAHDHFASSTAILSAPTPGAGDGWSPTVPWAATPMFAPGTKSVVSTPRPGAQQQQHTTPTKIRVKFKGDVDRVKDEEGGGEGRSLRSKGKGDEAGGGAVGGGGGEDHEMSDGEQEGRGGNERERRKAKMKGEEGEHGGVKVSRTREEDGEMDVDI